MIKQHSWTRQQYETAYSFMRRTNNDHDEYLYDSTPMEIWKAADYSYQAKDYYVTGWVNQHRKEKFALAMLNNKHSAWGIPF